MIVLLLFFLGLIVGSFVGASVWRLRAHQLRSDSKRGDTPTKHELSQVQHIHTKGVAKDRSVCLHCGHTLSWHDLIPLISWLSLGGKCRYCGKFIGFTEPIIELFMAVFFVISYLLWFSDTSTTFAITHLVVWLVASSLMAILFIYDARWFILPNLVTYTLVGLGLVWSGIVLYDQGFSLELVSSILYACIVLSGIYYVIYVISKHQWIGFGDVKLGLAMALLLADWKLAVVALLAANIIGLLAYLPSLLSRKMKGGSKIAFGPFLILGWALASIYGAQIIDWYTSLFMYNL